MKSKVETTLSQTQAPALLLEPLVIATPSALSIHCLISNQSEAQSDQHL